MRVLMLPSWYATDDKPWRGTFFQDQALALIRHGHEVDLAFVERKSFSRLTPAAALRHHFQIESANENGIPTSRMKAWGICPQTTRGAMLWTALTRRLVRWYVESNGVPDVIHGHGAMWGGYAAMLCSRDLGIPYVVTEHASSVMQDRLTAKNRALIAETYGNASAVIAVSDALKRRIASAVVIANCVDAEYFRPPRHDRATTPFVFLFVGDLVRSKRIDLLLRAFAVYRRDHPASRLVIAGAGKERRRLAELAGDAVEFTGTLSRSEIRRQMWFANALVLPSDFETFGVVLIEALATGIPVIATRCGGPEEFVTAADGLLINCGDEAALTRAMTSIRTRQFRAERLASSAGARFGYDVIAQQLCDVYQRVVARSPQRRAAARAASA